MRTYTPWLGAALAAALLAPPAVASADDTKPSAAQIAIPFERVTLKNGLTVILSESHDVPLVAVNVMVKVGSRFEREKRSGFAHLFEHLMFMGTDRAPEGAYDTWMETEGGWNNAWTSEDRTDYFDVAPAHVLPLLLWLEADRISSLGTSMTQEKLDAQRKVVRNERRQRSEEKPYGSAELRLPELLYPAGHPYHHPTIGSHEDLEAATVADVKDFFASYYVPNNMTLVVAGDFDKAAVLPQIEKLFGGLAQGAPPPPPSAGPEGQLPKLPSVVRDTLKEENIQLTKIIMAWHSPARFATGDAELDILANVLDRGKTSRLYKGLVFDKELAQSVNVSQSQQDLSSVFQVECILRPGVSVDEAEKEIDRLLREVVDKGVTTGEVERAKNDFETSFVLELESVPDRASMLNQYETYKGDPGYIGRDLERYRKVDATAVNAIAKSTLDFDHRVIVRVEPKNPPVVEAPKHDDAKPKHDAKPKRDDAKPKHDDKKKHDDTKKPGKDDKKKPGKDDKKKDGKDVKKKGGQK